ncbi:MAG: RNA polymerase sigma factor [Bacteroidaceae bacterium]|nr:RNA polymerase sigma factor [Bacteroidaceae bacterium]
MEDADLIQRILTGGDTQAFSQVVHKYAGQVYSRAFSLLRHEEEAREVAQQTFVKAYTNLSSWSGTSLGAWLSAIAAHLALDALRQAASRRTESLDAAQACPSTDGGEEHEALLQRMERAVGELAPDDRKLVTLHYYHHKKTDELAALTGMSQAAVLQRLHRIRQRLKQKLNNEHDG